MSEYSLILYYDLQNSSFVLPNTDMVGRKKSYSVGNGIRLVDYVINLSLSKGRQKKINQMLRDNSPILFQHICRIMMIVISSFAFNMYLLLYIHLMHLHLQD